MKKFLLILLLLSTCVGNWASAQKQDTLRIRVMTYNLRFGELASLEQIAEHIKAFKPDFVALQEVDSKTFRERAPKQNGKDFITELGYRTGMYPLYGKSITYKNGYYGIGILSVHPYFKVEKMMLPRPQEKEQRVMLQGTFEINGTDTITFACTHLDYFSEDTRFLQIQKITETLKQSPYPVILGGDFNARPDSKTVQKGMIDWELLTNHDLTFPAHKPSIKIDYLFGYPKSGWRVIRTQAVQSLLSDHLPIVTELELIRETK
ncbi:endonuclease/exonuclease/phosphatase family protein [Bacteroides sp.]